MNILKFGGTSMGDEHTWRKVLNIIDAYDRPFVVVSATARTTRQLLAAAQKAEGALHDAHKVRDDIRRRHQDIVANFLQHFPTEKNNISQECNHWIDTIMDELTDLLSNIHELQECTPAMNDAIASIGERLSSYLFAQCGVAFGLDTCWVDAAEVIRTDSDFGKASPDTDFINGRVRALINEMPASKIPVMGGYYGNDFKGNFTTLGFEGSDYTASLIGAALSAETIVIWTDVSGIYTCDPRVVSDARPIPKLSFQEATELAYFGAKVLHPSTTKPASVMQIPVFVKNIFEPGEPGTCISYETQSEGPVKAITFKQDCTVITVTSSNTVMGYEFLAGVFDILCQYHLPVDVVTTTEASVSIATENDNGLSKAVEKLQHLGSVKLTSGLGIISLVGCHGSSARSLIHEVLSITEGSSLDMVSYSDSKGNLNIVLKKENIIPSVLSIHKQFFR
ncbi:MAG: aspartate kinase [Balneolaceae bacterium]|jgi:aspartate kinase